MSGTHQKRIGAEGGMRQVVLWTHTEDATLRELAIVGLSLAEISKQMGRPKSGVRTRAVKLQIAIAKDENGMRKRTMLRQLPSHFRAE